MFVAPGSVPDFGRNLSRQAAQQVAGNWWRLLVNGLALIVAGVLIFSIDWSIRSLATFIGVLFIVNGVTDALTAGIDARGPAGERRHRTALDRRGHRPDRLAGSRDRRARDLPRRVADRHRHAHDLRSLRRPEDPARLVAAADHRAARDPARR